MDTSVDRKRHALSVDTLVKSGITFVPLALLGIFFIYPLLGIFAYSFQQDGQLDLSGFVRLASTNYYYETLLFTLYQATLSTLLTVGLALPVAYLFVHYRFWGKSLWLALLNLPFVLPTVVVAMAFTALLGERGVLNDILIQLFRLEDAPVQIERSLTIILMVHVFYNFSIALRMIVGYWANQSEQIEQAARILGADTWTLWWKIRLPLLRPILLASALLVFIFTFTSFGVVLILGGIQFATIEVQIYYQAFSLLDLPMAGALSLMQIVLVGLVMLFYTRLQYRLGLRAGLQLRRANTIAQKPRTLLEKITVYGALGIVVSLLLAPLFALVWMSVTVNLEGVSLQYYWSLLENTRNAILFVPPMTAISNSLAFALITTFFSVLLGMMVAYSIQTRKYGVARWIDFMFVLPLAVSAVTLGFGYLITLDSPPLNLRSSWLIIPIAHTVVALPFVIRSVSPALQLIPKNLLDAAHVLGQNDWGVWWRVQLPLVSRSVVVGAMFSFTISMGEFGASSFIARPDSPTLPIAIYRLLSQPRGDSFGQALAMSVILMVVCVLGFMLIERFREIGVGEF
jgi:thiamine transport system permease protein